MFRLVLSHTTVCNVIKNRDLDIHKSFYDICIIYFIETYQLRWLVTYIVVLIFVSHVDYYNYIHPNVIKNTRHDSKNYQIPHRYNQGTVWSVTLHWLTNSYFIYYSRTSVCMYILRSFDFYFIHWTNFLWRDAMVLYLIISDVVMYIISDVNHDWRVQCYLCDKNGWINNNIAHIIFVVQWFNTFKHIYCWLCPSAYCQHLNCFFTHPQMYYKVSTMIVNVSMGLHRSCCVVVSVTTCFKDCLTVSQTSQVLIYVLLTLGFVLMSGLQQFGGTCCLQLYMWRTKTH
jgi:hypothetical protein